MSSVAPPAPESAGGRLPFDRPLRVRGLEKSFGANQVIQPLDLDIPSGQFLAIVGRSGCGKSTLLRLLAGLEPPDGGSVRFDSQAQGSSNAAGGSPVRLMFQEPRLLPWASVLENVAVGFGRSKPDRARDKALVALADVGLADRADDWPSVLSGGQKQRVALARALVSQPSVLAFDEPLGALDALTRLEMQGLIERVFLAQGFTAVMVTHDVGEAVALADRILVLEAGRIALDVDVPCRRPRRRDDPQAVALEQRVLGRLLEAGPARGDSRDPRSNISRSAAPATQGMPA